MRKFQSSYSFAVLVFIVFFSIVHILTLKNGPNWGGDFSEYIRHAQNILQGKPYASRYYLNVKLVRPPGLPVLLVPFLRIFGLNFWVLKSITIFFWMATSWIVFRWTRRHFFEENSFLATVVLLSSPFFFMFKQNIGSDVLFLFFATATLYYFECFFGGRAFEKKRQRYFLMFLICLLLSFLFRWAGISWFWRFFSKFFRILLGNGFYLVGSRPRLSQKRSSCWLFQ